MIDEHRNAQWRANTRLTLIGLAMLGVLVMVVPLAAAWLGDISVLRFQLGFLIATLGVVAGMVALVYWFSARQSRIDQRFNISGDY